MLLHVHLVINVSCITAKRNGIRLHCGNNTGLISLDVGKQRVFGGQHDAADENAKQNDVAVVRVVAELVTENAKSAQHSESFATLLQCIRPKLPFTVTKSVSRGFHVRMCKERHKRNISLVSYVS